MSAPKKLPTGRLGRLAKLARAGTRTGVAMLRSRDATGSAEKVAAALGDLRGVATKVGQMVSYVDGLIPLEHQDTFERTMAKLRAGAPRSEIAAIRETVETELGAPIETLFAEWDDEPIASASIGQVHRAKLDDGAIVAVKVQHEGIAEAMEADLRNTALLDVSARAFGMGKFDVGRLAEEAKQRFREELDYLLEAERMEVFRELFAEDAAVRVPAVYRRWSTRRVLTTEFFCGRDFDAACASSDAERKLWAETLWRFVYGSIMLGGVFNADPHPGNYRFFDNGVVGFLDFGCVQAISNYNRRRIVMAHQALAEGEIGKFERVMGEVLDARPGKQRDAMADYLRFAVSPLRTAPFRITRSFASEVVSRFRGLALLMVKLRARDYSAMPEGILFLNRLQFGFYSVLARLDVAADYAAQERDFLDEAWARVRDLPDIRRIDL